MINWCRGCGEWLDEAPLESCTQPGQHTFEDAEVLAAAERIGNTAPDWGRRLGLSALWTEVLPGLWVGGTHDDDTVDVGRAGFRGKQQFHITEDAEIGPEQFQAVVTLYAFARPVDWHVEELRTGIYDNSSDGGRMGENELQLVLDAAAWAAKKWRSGKKVLIRCQAGLNRAPFTTAVLLMVETGMSANEAIQHLRQVRSEHVLFNKAFIRELHRLEQRLLADQLEDNVEEPSYYDQPSR